MLQFLSVDNGIITVFLGLLALAAYFDVREYRIPNRLSLLGIRYYRVRLDRRPGVRCCDRRVDRHGWVVEHDVPGGLQRADYCGRWVNRSADVISAFLPWT